LRRIVSKNHRATAAQMTAELNIHLEDPVSTKTVRREFHKSNIHGRAAIVKPLITENICVKDGVTILKPGYQITGNARVIWSDESSFTLFPASGRIYVWRTPKEAYNPDAWFQLGGDSVMVWAAIEWYSIFLVPLFMGELLHGNTWTGWVIRCVP
jgi:hypothetical protein